MYSKDKNERVTLRLNPAQFEFVKSSADMLGVSPSDFLRMVINTVMFQQGGEGMRRENEQTNKHNQL